jgi:peptidoglycan/LPS O-acetylase OafA/YrhL
LTPAWILNDSGTMTFPAAESNAGKHDYIDAVRGWAILLVMTTHVGGRFAEMPYPIKKFTNFGSFGVQMFFLASAITLAMSWDRSRDPYAPRTIKFFIRRFLRIAPMYYAGALLFALTLPPEDGIDPIQLLRTLLFINAWYPEWIPTTPGWMVVPGGWSIGVEFTFYALFPILITILTTLRRAIVFALVTVALAAVANNAGQHSFGDYGETAVSNFIYFWFPNQLPVFAIGIVLHHLIAGNRSFRLSLPAAYAAIAFVGLFCLAVAEFPVGPSWIGLDFFRSQMLRATLVFCVFIFVLSVSPPNLLVHPVIRRFGMLSFSCYVIHSLFVVSVPGWTGGLIDTSASEYRAIFMLGLLWLCVVSATYLCAEVTYLLIEQPGIRLAHRLTRSDPALRPKVVSAI